MEKIPHGQYTKDFLGRGRPVVLENVLSAREAFQWFSGGVGLLCHEKPEQ